MPTYILDSEQAELIELGIAVADAVLEARTRRADPDKVISASLTLQRRKLAQVLYARDQAAPLAFHHLPIQVQNAIIGLATEITQAATPQAFDEAWSRLHGIVIAFPATPT